MIRLRPALRLGRRMAFAKTGRAALIVALIGLPTMGFAGVSVLFTSTQPTTTEQLRYDLGHAQAQMTTQQPDARGMRQDPVHWTNTQTEENSPAAKADDDTPYADVTEYVPKGALAIPVTSTDVVLRGAHGPVGTTATLGDTWDPVLDGHWHVLDGTAPTARDQAMMTPAMLAKTGLRIGDTVDVTDPVTKRFTITGTMRDLGQDPDETAVYLPWGSIAADAAPISTGRSEAGAVTVYLPTVAPTWSEIKRLNDHGIVVQSRPVVLDPPDERIDGVSGPQSLGWYIAGLGLVGVFALFEVGLLAGAAFLVGTRADARSYAILTSVGAERGVVRSVVAGSGLVLGTAGAVLGTAIGVGIGALAFRLLDNGNVHAFPGLHVPVVMLLCIAVAGVVAGVLSSLAAARAATRVNVLAGLRGSLRPETPSRATTRRRRVWGPLLIVLGAVMTVACGIGVLVLNDRPEQSGQRDDWAWVVGAGVAIGPCLVQLGVAICSPWVLALVAGVSSRFGLAARMAGRDARRNPVRTVPVLASVMSVVFVASVVITWNASQHAQYVRDYQYSTAVGVATADVRRLDSRSYPQGYDAAVTARAAEVSARVLDHDRIRVLGLVDEQPSEEPSTLTQLHLWERPADCTDASCGSWLEPGGSAHVLTGTVDDYAVLTGHRPSAAVRDALADGKAVSLWPEYVHDDAVRLDTFRDRSWKDATSPDPEHPDATTTIPAVLDEQDPPIQIGVFMTKATAERYRVPAVDGLLVTRLDGEVSPEQWGALASAWQSYGGSARAQASAPTFFYESGPVDASAPVRALALALAAAVTIGATAVAIGLARADGRRDDEVLDAIGAAPRLRRRTTAWQAAILTTVGAVIGTVLGLLPIRALTLRFGETPPGVSHMPFVADWPVLALLAIGLPVLVTAGTWLTAGRGRRLSVRRAH
ncbi:FtsX-like permease family protein [Curtobacterium sp. 1P10AnD]|uniref:FtsX-like permease family protein n=1 Tax=Curtobacterium sp. 1P10AnD TaxID=3132283 RepID=UPI0039A0AACB